MCSGVRQRFVRFSSFNLHSTYRVVRVQILETRWLDSLLHSGLGMSLDQERAPVGRQRPLYHLYEIVVLVESACWLSCTMI